MALFSSSGWQAKPAKPNEVNANGKLSYNYKGGYSNGRIGLEVEGPFAASPMLERTAKFSVSSALSQAKNDELRAAKAKAKASYLPLLLLPDAELMPLTTLHYIRVFKLASNVKKDTVALPLGNFLLAFVPGSSSSWEK